MSARLSVLVSGDSKDDVVESFGANVWHLLADNGFVNRTTVGGVGFCRDLKQGALLAVLPKAFGQISDRSQLGAAQLLKENVFRLIRVFNKIGREGGFKINLIQTNRISGEIEDRSDPVLDSLEGALKLRRDYLANGIYLRKRARSVERSPSHPINWPRTLKKAPPLVDGGDIFFPSTVHRVRSRDDSHNLTALQLACLDDILRLTGEKHLLAGRTIATAGMGPQILRTAQATLRRLNSEIFDERGRALIKSISAYLEVGRLRSSEQIERDQLLAYTADFENIWEHVLRRLFGPEGESRTMAVGKWHPYPSQNASEGIAPEVDVFTRVSGTPVILDAKDYRLLYSPGDRFGNAGDYYKQIIYGTLLGAAGETPKPTNILLFPGINQETLFRINGCHRWREIPNSVVFEVTVDYEMAIQRWLGERSIDTAAELAKLVSDLKNFDLSIALAAKC